MEPGFGRLGDIWDWFSPVSAPKDPWRRVGREVGIGAGCRRSGRVKPRMSQVFCGLPQVSLSEIAVQLAPKTLAAPSKSERTFTTGFPLKSHVSGWTCDVISGALQTSCNISQGAGHSVGLHSALDARAQTLATAIPTSRIIVNQAHTFATGGSFTNGMPFSLSMGCGTWGGNSVNENVNYRHFLQSTKIIREIPSREPKVEDIFDGYWSLAGK